ncbi:MAG TPA: sulfotransferase [Dongiaceae bacterium]|nr:sulfotransferase [Dongiaceae bacterium]
MEGSLLRVADRLAQGAGLFRRPLKAEELAAAACRRTGLGDFGEKPFEALAVLLESYDREASLSLFGRFAARWDVLRFLMNLLRLREAERRDPAILEQPIVRPIFITGLPRSGTTFLHNLLAQDPDNLVPLCWETIYPCPERPERPGSADRRPRKVDRQIAAFARLAPELGRAHPMTAYSAQECTEITAHVFQSLRLDTTHHVPSYRRWLDGTGHLAAYRFHKRFLQHMQRQKGPGRWILKCPDHVFALEAIRAVYPDAQFVVLHRDPVKVLYSVARLTEVLRRPFTRRLDRLQIGRQVNEHWQKGAALLVEADARGLGPAVRHLEYGAFVADPFRAVAGLYAQFGLPLGYSAAARMKAFIAARPDGGYARRPGRLEEYGLDAEALRDAYRRYTDHFAIAPEADGATRGEVRRSAVL